MILLFAELLQKELPKEVFKGHIGGDDFFIGIRLGTTRFEEALEMVEALVEKFEDEVKSLYNPEDRNNGYIRSKDRDGSERTFALLSMSSVVVEVCSETTSRAADLLQKHFAEQKYMAKSSLSQMSVTTML